MTPNLHKQKSPRAGVEKHTSCAIQSQWTRVKSLYRAIELCSSFDKKHCSTFTVSTRSSVWGQVPFILQKHTTSPDGRALFPTLVDSDIVSCLLYARVLFAVVWAQLGKWLWKLAKSPWVCDVCVEGGFFFFMASLEGDATLFFTMALDSVSKLTHNTKRLTVTPRHTATDTQKISFDREGWWRWHWQ